MKIENILKLSNAQIATIGVSRLGGDSRAVDAEDVALEVYKLAANRFGWRKYPERPVHPLPSGHKVAPAPQGHPRHAS